MSRVHPAHAEQLRAHARRVRAGLSGSRRTIEAAHRCIANADRRLERHYPEGRVEPTEPREAADAGEARAAAPPLDTGQPIRLEAWLELGDGSAEQDGAILEAFRRPGELRNQAPHPPTSGSAKIHMPARIGRL